MIALFKILKRLVYDFFNKTDEAFIFWLFYSISAHLVYHFYASKILTTEPWMDIAVLVPTLTTAFVLLLIVFGSIGLICWSIKEIANYLKKVIKEEMENK